MTGNARPPRPRVPWAPLLAGFAVLAAGAVAAHRVLPEWQPLGVSKESALKTARDEMAAAGATLLSPKAKVRNALASSELERAYRRLGREAPAWLARHGALGSWVVSGDLRIPGVGTGRTEIAIGRDGSMRRLEFTSGSVFRIAAPAGELAGARERFADAVLARLAPAAMRSAPRPTTRAGMRSSASPRSRRGARGRARSSRAWRRRRRC